LDSDFELSLSIDAKDTLRFVMGYEYYVESPNVIDFVNNINRLIKYYKISKKSLEKMLSDWSYYCQFWLDRD